MDIKANGGRTIYILFNAAIAIILALLAIGVNQLNNNISNLATKHDRLEGTVNAFIRESAVTQTAQDKDIKFLQKSIERAEKQSKR